jgi:hypoxanthine phosphoribosyltransferase
LKSSQPAQKNFAHPAEEEFSRILDFYGLEWEYEPRTFPLEWDAEKRVTIAFTPDFYLPEQDLYIELTTLRPHLSTHKNRKMRLMKELYPEIKIKLMKRKEIHDLLVKYGLDQVAERYQGTESQRKLA